MSKFETALRLWKRNKRDIIIPFYNKLVRTGIFNRLSDELFLKQTYWIRFGKKLNLEQPRTFNEKLNWLKIHDRNPMYSLMVDKYEAKKIVSEKIGAQYIVPTIGVYESVDLIDFEQLPNAFAIKCTHDSGSVAICKNKSQFDINQAKRMLCKGLNKNLFFWAREWPYKNVQPRIIVEEYISGLEENLVVYKVFCFHGCAEIIQVIQNDKKVNETIDYYDRDWNRLQLSQDYPNSKSSMPRPKALEKMLALSECFLQERPFIRVDWYIVNDKILFSEFTFFSDAGLAYFNPEEWDEKLGALMKI